MKTAALGLAVPVLEPERLRGFDATLRDLGIEALVVASYGRILPQAVLDAAPLGAFNVHPSLLPLYRGATPLQTAIRDGRAETGVTVMLMDAGMDTGDVVLQERTPLGASETYGELHDRLAKTGARMLLEALRAAGDGGLVRHSQSTLGVPETEIRATVTRPIAKADLLLNLYQPARDVANVVRSLAPQPLARVEANENLKVIAARALTTHEFARETTLQSEPPGAFGLSQSGLGMLARTSDGAIVLERVIPAGRAEMAGDAYLRGRRAPVGTV